MRNLRNILLRYLRDKADELGKEFYTTTWEEMSEEMGLADEQREEVFELMEELDEKGYFDTYWVEARGVFYTVTLNKGFLLRGHPRKPPAPKIRSVLTTQSADEETEFPFK